MLKKCPFLQGFPDFETVKFFTGKSFQKYNFLPVFYDIETTGLSRNSTFLYLIGAVGAVEDGNLVFITSGWPNVTKEEETILRIFSQFLQNSMIASFPIMESDSISLIWKPGTVNMSCHPLFSGKKSLDLYLTLKPLKTSSEVICHETALS